MAKSKKKAKKGYKKCSVKGCGKKAVVGRRCQKHADEELTQLRSKGKIQPPSEKEIPRAPLSDIAKKIKTVKTSTGVSSETVPAEEPSHSRDGFLNDLTFEAGIICGKFSSLFKQGEE